MAFDDFYLLLYNDFTMPKRKNRKAKSVKAPKKFYHSNCEKEQRKKGYDPRQLIAVKKLSEIVRKSKGKKVTIERVLKEAGYSSYYSKQGQRALKGIRFQKLLEKHLPDALIAETHEGVLKASKLDHYVFPARENNGEIKKVIESVAGCKLVKIRRQKNWKRAYFLTPENPSRIRAIAEAYKLKDKYPAEKHKVEGEIKTVKVVNYATKK